MKHAPFSQRTQQALLASMLAMGALTAAQPALAETEIESLKRELAEQRKLIERLLAAQPAQAAAPSAAPAAPAPAAPTAATPATAAAASPSNFSFYGTIDVNVMSADSGYGAKTSVGTGGMNASSLGVKGQRDVGAGIKVVGELEAGIALDNGVVSNGSVTLGINNNTPSSGGLTGGGAQIFSRQAYAGLSTEYGSLTLGRQYTGSYIAAAVHANALGSGFLGNGATFLPVIGGMPTRVNNSIVYKTPTFNGLSGHLTYTVGNENNVSSEVTSGTTRTDDGAGQGWDLLAHYKSGNLTAAASTWRIRNNSYVIAGETSLAIKQGQQLAVNYDFGGPRLYASYVAGEIAGGNYENVTKTLSKASGWSLSGAMPFGKSTLIASYARLDDESLLNKDGTLFGLSYTRELAANTKIYASWARQLNEAASTYALPDGGDLVGTVATPGFSPSGFMVGLNIKF